jgi:small conductance mechanosensitive channel
VAKIASNLLERSMNRVRFHRTLILFIKHVVFYSLLTFVIIAALNKLGVETSSFIAVLGAASLAVGLALQGSLSNFAAGIMIIVLSLFEIGDTIDAGGVQGDVEEIQIFNTVIITTDKRRVIVPNSKITGDKITIFPHAMPPI